MTPVPPDPAAGPPVPGRAARTPGGPGLSPSPERPGGKTSRLLPWGVLRQAAAGIQSPARGARASSQATSAPLGGSTGRTYTVALPPGLKLLSLNDRLHWSERARRTEALKKAAWAMALQAKIPPLERVAVIAEYRPPAVRRRRDAENIPAPSAKACLDGIVQAGVLRDDECPRYVSKIVCTIGEPYPKGRLVLYLIEVGATPESDGAS